MEHNTLQNSFITLIRLLIHTRHCNDMNTTVEITSLFFAFFSYPHHSSFFPSLPPVIYLSLYSNSIAASAVCAFNLSAITQAFNGPFRSQENPRSTWLPTPNPIHNFQVSLEFTVCLCTVQISTIVGGGRCSQSQLTLCEMWAAPWSTYKLIFPASPESSAEWLNYSTPCENTTATCL